MSTQLPAYVAEPFSRCSKSLLYTYILLTISKRGIGTVSNYPKMAQRIIDLTVQVGQEITDDLKRNREEADKFGKFANDELADGFPFIHGFGTVGIWGILEVVVEDVLLGILLNEPNVRDKEEIAKIRVPLSKYEGLEKEERMRFVLAELTRAQSSTAQGVGAFEPLLRLFDLSGDVDEVFKKTLWEMNHVRNVIVHRGSYADSRLVQSCPWMGLKVGDRILVDDKRFEQYMDGVLGYVHALESRLHKRYGASGSPDN